MEANVRNKKSTETLVFGAILTALVIVLQFMGSFIRFGPFSISLVLMPIVIGASVCGAKIGAWLGLVFGVVVLVSGDASAFLVLNAPGTLLTVLGKGIACGTCAGLVYKQLESVNRSVAVMASAVACPVVNTGVFLLGCGLFFWDTLVSWAEAANFGNHVVAFMILGLVGINFVIELIVNIVLSPVIVRLIRMGHRFS